MAFKQLNLDTLPVNPLIDINDAEYKSQLNLAFNTSQSLNNIAEYTTALNNKLQQEPNTVKTLNYTLESYLYLLLSTSTISNLDNTQLSSYFSKKKLVDPDYYQFIESDYLNTLEFTNYKVWGTNFGSLGYYLYTSKANLHFSHPSNLVRLSVEELVKELRLPDYSTKILQTIRSKSIKDDYALYLASTSFIKELDLLAVITQLDFYSTWVPEILTWYSGLLETDIVNPYKLDTSVYNAFNLLVEMSQALVKLGLYADSFTNLTYKFLHQDLSSITLEGIQSVNLLRRQKEFEVTTDLTEEERLISKLFLSIKSNNLVDLISQESYKLLSLNLPGGLNLWLTAIAAELVNRAYILTYGSTYKDNFIYPVDSNEELVNLLDRVYKLLFYAGYCLKKTNLNHLQLIGFNLRLFSQLEEDTSLQEYNLLE